jgi:hypothetical protein
VKCHPRSLAWALPLWAGLAQCAEPLHAPSAFTEERYLCDTPEFDTAVGQCREGYLRDGSCIGLVFFHGIIDREMVVVDSLATSVQAPVPALPGGQAIGLGIWGKSPYFKFRFAFGDPAKVSAASVGAVPAGSATDVDSNADLLNLEARGGNYLAILINETREIQVLESDEIGFNFSADITRGGHVDGCVDVFLGHKP